MSDRAAKPRSQANHRANGQRDVGILKSYKQRNGCKGYESEAFEAALTACRAIDESHDALVDLYIKRFAIQIEVSATSAVGRNWQASG